MKSRTKRADFADSDPVPLRAALYMRVSTGRQADSDLSIPDQRHQANNYCAARGWKVVAEFVDAGLSGTDDNRPELQRLLEMATAGSSPFDVVIIHSFSRFARDLIAFELNARRLKKAGVRIISITQDLGEDDNALFLRRILASVDEHHSRENAKHTLRAMEENARQGFWNGSLPPYGYQAVIVEQRGARIKKKLAIEPIEAETIRLIFRLFRQGDGKSGPMGVKKLVIWLNEHDYRTRKGSPWRTGPLHALLKNTAYKGEHFFNRKTWKTRMPKPLAQHIPIAVEPIIEAHIFDEVQATLKARNPRVTPPRTVTGPILLTGLATCATCGGGMTLRTGKYGRYRYYTCATSAQMGKGQCRGRSIPMDKLDNMVMERILGDLLTPRRVGTLLTKLMDRQAERAGARASQLAAIRKKLTDAESRLKRLYSAIEAGLADLDDPTLKDRIGEVRGERDRAKAALAQATSEASSPSLVSPEKIAAFTNLMQTNLRGGDTPFRRAYLRALIDKVEVDDAEIRIHGRRTILERLVAAGEGAGPASVPSFVREWRPRQDSNLRPSA